MASFFFGPDPLQSTFLVPGGNTPATGAQLFIYVAGSVSTKTTVYKDNAGNTAWSNPIVLDSGGNLPSGGVIWIPSGVSIKAVWAPSNDTDPPTSPYRTIDNIAGINDVTGSQTEWTVGPTPTFISITQFTLVGDQTSIFTKGRRLKFTVTAGTVYGVITTSAFGVLTTINVAFDSGALDSGLSAVSYSVISPSNSSIGADYSGKYATTVPSVGAGTTNIWGIAGDYSHVTGTNNINHFSTAPYPGACRDIVFDNVLTIGHTSNGLGISCPGNLPIITGANDRARVRADTATFSVITQYTRGIGVPVAGVQTSNTVWAGPVSGAAAAPTFRPLTVGDGAAYAWISATTVPSTTTIDVFWTAAQASAVDVVELEFVGLRNSTNDQGTLMRFTLDGATFDSANAYQWTNQLQQSNPASNTNAGSGGVVSSIQFIQQSNNGATASGAGHAFLFQPSNSSGTKIITGKVVSVTSGNGVQDATFGGMYTSTSALRGVRVLAGSGNISGSLYAKGRLKG